MRVTGRRLALLGMCLLAGGALSCAAIWGFQDLKPSATDGGGSDGGLDATDEPFVCNGEHPPDPPNIPVTAETSSYVLALRTIDIGVYSKDAGVAPTKSYDLDGVCTCASPNQEGCQRPSNASTDTCDDDRGRDDVGRTLLAKLRGFLTTDALTTESATSRMQGGKFGVLIGVQSYNGKADDSDVQAFIVPSHGLPNGAVVGGFIDRDNTLAAKFDGTDRWSYDPAFGSKLADNHIIGSYGSTKAYVHNNVAVAYFGDVFVHMQVFVTNSNPLTIHMSDAVMTATVVPKGNSFALVDGRLSGRWLAGDLLRAVGVWEFTSPPLGAICPDNKSLFKYFTDIVCPGRDILGRAGGAKTLPCDAISFSMAFTAEPALIGEPASYPYVKTACFDGGYEAVPDGGYPVCP